MSPTIVQGTAYIDNPLHGLLIPHPNQKVYVSASSIVIHGAARSFAEYMLEFKAVAVEITHSSSSYVIPVVIFEDRQHSSVAASVPVIAISSPPELLRLRVGLAHGGMYVVATGDFVSLCDFLKLEKDII
ncbi:hypothetical protein BDZ89DRAFT_1148812 [Hymenopellis radicata]|nr:hypothetical protein BDZ89DRAFT_1148812 [Hymenopellis radicata]